MTTAAPLQGAPDLRRAVWDRGTRRWARIGALVLVASVALPNVWLEPGRVHMHWFWERADLLWEWHDRSPMLPPDPIPSVCLWLGLSGLAWWAAGRAAMARRGMWLTSATVLVVAVAFPDRWIQSADAGMIPWPLSWPQLYLVSAALGLLLQRTRAQPAVGRGLCAFGGLYVLGTLGLHLLNAQWRHYWPRPWADFTVRHLLEYAHLLLESSAGALLLWTGAARVDRPRVALSAGCAFFASLAVGLAADYFEWGRRLEWAQAWDGRAEASSVCVHLRLWMRPYGALILVVTGLFAWIVGARSEGALPAPRCGSA